MKNRKRINKLLLLIIALVVLTAVLVGALKDGGSKDNQESSSVQAVEEPSYTKTNPSKSSISAVDPDTPVSSESSETQAKGRYTTYSESNRSANGYNTNVIFFHAGWCPECRAFKQAIQNGDIPNGVQILETNYDTSGDLKKLYGVTLQSTFVRVDSNGNLQKKWVGYGKEKSINAILSNL